MRERMIGRNRERADDASVARCGGQTGRERKDTCTVNVLPQGALDMEQHPFWASVAPDARKMPGRGPRGT